MENQVSKLDVVLKDIDSCNTYFNNHVGSHDKDYLRKGIILVQVIAMVFILLI